MATTTNPPNNNGPNPSPNVGIVNSYATGIYEVPRHPNDVFYNVANWADDQAEFDCVYSYYVPPDHRRDRPAPDPPFNTYNAAQVLDFTSSAFVTNMLMGDMDPEMFHQPDLHFSDNYADLTNAAPSGTIPASVTAFAGQQRDARVLADFGHLRSDLQQVRSGVQAAGADSNAWIRWAC